MKSYRTVDYKIIYRPHPWRQSNEIIKYDYLDNIIIDPQIKEAYLSLDDSFQPDLSYYPSLIKNAEFPIYSGCVACEPILKPVDDEPEL